CPARRGSRAHRSNRRTSETCSTPGRSISRMPERSKARLRGPREGARIAAMESQDTLEEMIREAHRRFDALNAEDPRTLSVDGVARPRELLQADRLEAWLHRVVPTPSVPQRLAARCQHLARFRIPRADYPEGRVGYLTWRRELAQMHARLATEILEAVGFDEPTREAVQRILLKRDLHRD